VVARNVKEAIGRRWWGMVQSAFYGSLKLGGSFCVCAFDRKMFSHLIYFMNTFYKFTFNVIWEDNSTINFITVLHKKGFITVNSYS
jgi:hypothetical protein